VLLNSKEYNATVESRGTEACCYKLTIQGDGNEGPNPGAGIAVALGAIFDVENSSFSQALRSGIAEEVVFDVDILEAPIGAGQQESLVAR
jgi:hypothetical protein